jgi:hypothetical protein
LWEFISGIKPPQKRKTDKDKNAYCYKYLKKPVLPDEMGF